MKTVRDVRYWSNLVATVSVIIVFIGSSFIFYDKVKNLLPRVERLEYIEESNRIERFVTLQYIDAIAKRVLTESEYKKLTDEVELMRRDAVRYFETRGTEK